MYGRANRVHTLVTLGSPHKSKEKYPFGRFPEKLWVEGEQHLPPHERCTSSLQFANKFYPDGNSFSDVRIACIAGDVTTGALCEAYRELEFSQDATPLSKRRNILARMGLALTAYESYKAGCEKANVRGDVITPIEIAHLDGAENVILHGVWHGPPFFTTKWYGTEYNQWMHYLYPPIDAKKQHTDPKANEILGRQS